MLSLLQQPVLCGKLTMTERCQLNSFCVCSRTCQQLTPSFTASEERTVYSKKRLRFTWQSTATTPAMTQSDLSLDIGYVVVIILSVIGGAHWVSKVAYIGQLLEVVDRALKTALNGLSMSSARQSATSRVPLLVEANRIWLVRSEQKFLTLGSHTDFFSFLGCVLCSRAPKKRRELIVSYRRDAREREGILDKPPNTH